MIIMTDVSYFNVTTAGRKRWILKSVSSVIPTNRKIGILGRSPMEVSVFLEIMSGVRLPTSGKVQRIGRVSPPISHLPAFDPASSLRRNVGHIARLYGIAPAEYVEFIDRTLEIGSDFDVPFGNLTREVAQLCGQIVICALPFDIYIINGNTRRGPPRLRELADALVQTRLSASGALIAKDQRFLSQHCDMCICLRNSGIFFSEDVQEMISAYTKLQHAETSWAEAEPEA